MKFIYLKHIILLSCFLAIGIFHAQSEEKILLNKGVNSYNNGDYASAQNKFEEAYAKNSNYNLALYNAANAAYRNGNFEKALEYYNQYAGTLSDKNTKAKAYHNVGNAYLKQNKLKESIDAYKNALRNNPNDEDTRYNLSYALSKLKQQQQQNQDLNKDNQNKDQQNKNEQGDQNKDQQNKGEQENKDQNGDQKDQNKDQKDGEGDQEKDQQKDQEGNNQPKPGDQQKGNEKEMEGQMTKGQIEKDLDAINNDEKNILLKIARKKGKENKTSNTKDW